MILAEAHLFIIMTYSCTLKHTSKSMDIAEFIDGRNDIEEFIEHHFDKVNYDGFANPLLIQGKLHK
jgi:hypothetical protein